MVRVRVRIRVGMSVGVGVRVNTLALIATLMPFVAPLLSFSTATRRAASFMAR